MEDIKKEILLDAIKSCIEAERRIIKYRRACIFLGAICLALCASVVVITLG